MKNDSKIVKNMQDFVDQKSNAKSPIQKCIKFLTKETNKHKLNYGQLRYIFRSDIEWKHDEAIIFGKLITTKRKVAWYGDRRYSYTYSGRTREALQWVDSLLEIKRVVEKNVGESFNSALLNYYHNGEEGMAWHSDGEKDLKRHGVIASLSLGASRRFCFKHKINKKKVEILLEHGSLITMSGVTQDYWLHSLPKMKKVKGPRVNITFRQIAKTI